MFYNIDMCMICSNDLLRIHVVVIQVAGLMCLMCQRIKCSRASMVRILI